MKKHIYKIASLLFLFLSAGVQQAKAQAVFFNDKISVQGYLKQGATALSGNYNIEFQVVKNGVTPVWCQDTTSVAVTSGIFNQVLSGNSNCSALVNAMSPTVFTAAANSDYFQLSIIVDVGTGFGAGAANFAGIDFVAAPLALLANSANYAAQLTTTGASGQFLKSNGSSWSAATIAASDVTGLGTAATVNTGNFVQVANNLSDVVAATARTNLGLVTGSTATGSLVQYSAANKLPAADGSNLTNVAAATLGGGTFAAPGAIGSGTPATSIATSGVITSTLATGTAPFTVASTTVVPNLNASFLNGATFAAPGAIGSGTPATSMATSGVITSTLPNGTAPFVLSSSTMVTGLNAQYLANGTWAAPGAIGTTTPNTGAFSSISASGVITSTVSTGTAPFSVASLTVVPNLNAGFLNGQTFANPGAIGGGTPSTATFTNILLSSNGFNEEASGSAPAAASGKAYIYADSTSHTLKASLNNGTYYDLITSATGNTNYVRLDGTVPMTGLLTLSGDPSAALGTATKQYVDSVSTTTAANYIRKDGTVTYTGSQAMGSNKITGLADGTAASDAAAFGQIGAAISTNNANYLALAGGTMSGAETFKVGSNTAGGAPIYLQAGTSLTAPVNGAVEFDGTNLYFTDSGPVRRTVATTTSVATSLGSYAPLASPTFTGTVTIPSGSNLGTPTTLVGTNITGTAASLTVGNATNAVNATNIGTVSTSANTNFYPLFAGSSSNGNQVPNLGTGMTFNPSTNNLSTTTFTGALAGNATSATLAATVTTNANLTGPITSSGNTTSVASQTGTGSKFVMDTNPVLVTPNLGTPSALVLTNGTGLPLSTGVSGFLSLLNGGTGVAAGSANAAFNALSPMTTGGDLIYGGASGAATRLANGSAGQVLTSAGTTLAPTWTTPTTGTVTAVSVVTSNGFAGSSGGGATPALTLTTSVTGILKGNGTAMSAASAGTDYLMPTGSVAISTTHGGGVTATSGPFTSGAIGTSNGSLILNGSTSGSVSLSVPATIANQSWILPVVAPTANQFLQSIDTSGTLVWASPSSFSGSLSGDVTGTQGATAISAATVTGKLITGYSSGSGTVAATDTILGAIQKLNGNDALKMPLAGGAFSGAVTTSGNFTQSGATTFGTGTGAVSVNGPATFKVGAAAVGGAPIYLQAGSNLTAAVSGAIEFDGTNLYFTDNVPTRRTIATATAVAGTYAPIASPTFTGTVNIPNGSALGTPTTLVGTNITGTGSSFTAGTATNATNMTTVSTSTNASFFPIFAASSSNGNQAFNLGTGLSFNPSTNNLSTTTFTGALAGNSTTATNIAGGLVGQIPYQTGAGATTLLANVAGNSGQVLMSNGAAAPSWSQTLNPTGTLALGGAVTTAVNIQPTGASAAVNIAQNTSGSVNLNETQTWAVTTNIGDINSTLNSAVNIGNQSAVSSGVSTIIMGAISAAATTTTQSVSIGGNGSGGAASNVTTNIGQNGTTTTGLTSVNIGNMTSTSTSTTGAVTIGGNAAGGAASKVTTNIGQIGTTTTGLTTVNIGNMTAASTSTTGAVSIGGNSAGGAASLVTTNIGANSTTTTGSSATNIGVNSNSSSGTSTVNIGTLSSTGATTTNIGVNTAATAGVPTVSIGTVGVVGSGVPVINIGSFTAANTSSSTITIGSNTTGGAGSSVTTSIGGNATNTTGSSTVNIGVDANSSTGASTINIGTGTSAAGTTTVTIGSATNANNATLITAGSTGGVKINGGTAITRAVVYCSTATAATTSYAIGCTGVTTSHLCFASITGSVVNGTNTRNIISAVSTANTCTVTTSGISSATANSVIACVCY